MNETNEMPVTTNLDITTAKALKRYGKICTKVYISLPLAIGSAERHQLPLEKGAFLRAIAKLADDASVQAEFDADAVLYL